MGFKTTNLVDNRVLVTGTDIAGTDGKVILDSAQWTELAERKVFDSATSEFDDAVAAFFAPLTEAADKVDAVLNTKVEDGLGYLVIEEASEGVAPTAGLVVKLTKDSQILRLIEQGNTDRLVWVGDSLEITDPQPMLPLFDAPATAAPQAEVFEDVTEG